MEANERLCLYFDQAIDMVCKGTIVEQFVNSLQDIKPVVNELEDSKHNVSTFVALKQIYYHQKKIINQKL